METVQLAKKTVKLTTKYYVHPVFNNCAASKKGVVINVKTRRELKPRINSGYAQVCICDKSLKEKQKIIPFTNLFTNQSKELFLKVLRLTTSI